ncbi:peptidyl-tRNA hydrolase [Dellaglioa algida]|uniref:Peptidyl-tRNA hydrolase n=2 Tax=Dellaglioa algida TaxID=105612 RepID=A0A5C6M918_9LACO|nr:peptidyl-tRNA hydrolase [Dellaglioa algida]
MLGELSNLPRCLRLFKGEIEMKMIVGLGNIGQKYDGTRHNVGFATVDAFAKQYNTNFGSSKYEAQVASFNLNGEKIVLVKPSTYMNESGRAVRPLMDFYKIDVSDILIVNDDLDLEVGRIRLRQKGSAGGHNGLKSIIAHTGTQEFKRIKIGIDHPDKVSVVDWVLTKFSKNQEKALGDAINTATLATEDWLETDDFMNTMNKYNHK